MRAGGGNNDGSQATPLLGNQGANRQNFNNFTTNVGSAGRRTPPPSYGNTNSWSAPIFNSINSITNMFSGSRPSQLPRTSLLTQQRQQQTTPLRPLNLHSQSNTRCGVSFAPNINQQGQTQQVGGAAGLPNSPIHPQN